MKRYYLILCMLIAFLGGEARCQTHIYERYADHTDLEVAYLESLPLDSVNAINVTIIIAKDSTAWEWLKEEFHIEGSPFSEHTKTTTSMIRDKQNPASIKHTDILNGYYVVANFYRKAVVIYQYETIEQFHSIIHFSINNIRHEKN